MHQTQLNPFITRISWMGPTGSSEETQTKNNMIFAYGRNVYKISPPCIRFMKRFCNLSSVSMRSWGRIICMIKNICHRMIVVQNDGMIFLILWIKFSYIVNISPISMYEKSIINSLLYLLGVNLINTMMQYEEIFSILCNLPFRRLLVQV